MSQRQPGTVLHYLRELAIPRACLNLTDPELLERFKVGDQNAFASLVKRHGRLVWDVCRRVLGDDHEAEDAFQAVFLILACKAGSVRRPESLGSWLHGVAVRAAMNAKRKAARRRVHEQRQARPQACDAGSGTAWPEVQRLLDEEVRRLPATYQSVFVLCCMEGKSLADTAATLGKTEGAVSVALSRARQQLRRRLAERGVVLESMLALVALTGASASAAVPVGLLGSAIRAVSHAVARQTVIPGAVSDQVAVLAKTVMKEMMMKTSVAKLSIVTAGLLLAGTLAAQATWLSGPAQDSAQAPGNPVAAASAKGKDGRGGRRDQIAERIAWGKVVDDLQAGLEVRPEGRISRLGESLNFVIWVRNVGRKPGKLAYRAGWYDATAPAVIDGDGKAAEVAMPPRDKSPGPVLELLLDPGQSAELTPVTLAVTPTNEHSAVQQPTARITPGTYKVSYADMSTSQPKLATGHVEIVLQRAAAAREKKAEPLSVPAKRLVGSWRGNGAAGPTYLADGTGKNPDGTKFEWRLQGDFLLARRMPSEGKPAEWSRMVILFSQDANEYRVVLDKEYSFFRVLPGGKEGEQRTEKGRTFPRRQVPREDDGNLPAIAPTGPGTNRGAIVHVGSNVHVSKANASVLHAEVVLAADPVDPQRLVAASMYNPPPVDPANPKVIVYASSDRGQTWAPTLERRDTHFADPAFAWGERDFLFLVSLQAPSLARWRDRSLEFIRSRDGGQSWNKAATIKENHDRPFLAVDNTMCRFNSRLYCLTDEGLLVSTDSGQSFGRPRSWARRPDYVPYGSGNPLVLSDGTLVVLYKSSKREDMPSQQGTGQALQYLGVRASRDGGDSFSDETVVAEGPGCDFPMAASASAHSNWRDRVYVVWQEALREGRRCVKYAYSNDRGTTFCKPVLLSEQFETKENYDAYLPSIAVNKAGVVAVTWYDTRGLKPDEAGWNVRVRASVDGGGTWEPSVLVTDAPTIKDKNTAKRILGVGHTAGLAADADGVFHCLWVDGRSSVQQVWTAMVRVGPADR